MISQGILTTELGTLHNKIYKEMKRGGIKPQLKEIWIVASNFQSISWFYKYFKKKVFSLNRIGRGNLEVSL